MIDCFKGEKDDLARFGGDKFIAKIYDLESRQDALQAAVNYADKILKSLQQPLQLKGQEVFTNAHIGMSVFPQDAHDSDGLLKNTDISLYAAKAEARGHYRFFDSNMNTAVHKRQNIQNHLRRALEREELEIYYQPQVEVHSGEIVAMEALLRWQNSQLGSVSPAEFIPVAEDCGLILTIGEWVLETACQQNKRWQDQGLKPVRMCVNLSISQFYSPGLLNTIETILEQTQLSAQWLELEFTENIALKCTERGYIKITMQRIHALKQLGIYLAMDDFGTGYSSLSYLNQFKMDSLKIDASFIRELNSSSGASLACAIINMAHGLHMKVIAEGVETEEQMIFLRQKKCDLIQGYFFYHPQPAEQISALLNQPLGLKG